MWVIIPDTTLGIMRMVPGIITVRGWRLDITTPATTRDITQITTMRITTTIIPMAITTMRMPVITIVPRITAMPHMPVEVMGIRLEATVRPSIRERHTFINKPV